MRGNQFLIEWMIRAMKNTWLCPAEVPINIRNWMTIEEGQMAIEGTRNKRSCV